MCQDRNNEYLEVYTINELKNLLKYNVIHNNLVIRGGYIKSLEGVSSINGSLGINDARIESLGELIEISNDFWISYYSEFSRITTLEKLKRIGGNAIFRYSNLNNLGALKEVGGNLSLRDTPIKDLGALQYVGGYLYLPKRLKDKLNLNHIIVKGGIRFWKDGRKNKKLEPKENIGLIRHSESVPFWKNQYVNSVADIEKTTIEQQQFYIKYKQNFKKGIFIDIEGNENYSKILFYDLLREHSKNIEELKNTFQKLAQYYPNLISQIKAAIIDETESINDFEGAWKLINENGNISILTIIEYEQKLHRELLNEELIMKLGGKEYLTNFGKNNIEKIKPFIYQRLKAFEEEKGQSFFELFFINGIPHFMTEEKEKVFFSQEYYKQFYINESEYNFYKKIDDRAPKLNNLIIMSHVVENAILNQCRIITKEAEDLYRKHIGMPKIGEGWISETELYYKVATRFPEYKVIQHGSPKWLGRQHLDIYFPEFNIGIEYQGAQHFEPVEFFGGNDALIKTKERDEIKRKKCLENKCYLIYVKEGYNLEELILQIRKEIRKRQ